MDKGASIYVAGHNGMVGSAIVRRLQSEGFNNLLMASKADLDLTDQKATAEFFDKHQPEYVFCAAAKVGGIHANNTYPASFLYENIMIEANVINSAYQSGVKKLLFLGSSCIYPKLADQPLKESALLTGELEPTNEAYAVAKIAGIKLCEYYRKEHGCNFISVMPTNLYGPGDNYHPENSHVLPALLRRIHEAKTLGQPSVTIWGSGAPLREFMHVDDLADACVFLMQLYNDEGIINAGTGEEISIADLARLIAEVVDYDGAFEFDATKPDGTPRKLLNSSKLHNLGWQANIGLKDGITTVYSEVENMQFIGN